MTDKPLAFDDNAAAADALAKAPPVTEGATTEPVEPIATAAMPVYEESAADRKASGLFGKAAAHGFKELTDEEAPDLLSDACEALASIGLEFSSRMAGAALWMRVGLVGGAMAMIFIPAIISFAKADEEGAPNAE